MADATDAPPDAELFGGAFLAGLDRLRLATRRRLHGARPGDRLSRRLGSSLEFAEHREYSPGDEPRTLDWNAFGRLDRLYVKRFHDEDDVHVLVLVDSSASMRWGPGGRKFAHARRAAAAVACVALAGSHEVSLCWFGARLGRRLGPLRGESGIARVLAFLSAPPAAGGGTSLGDALGEAARSTRRRSLAVVASDFLDGGGFGAGLGALRFRRMDPVALQVVDPLEREPASGGQAELVDCESGARLSADLAPARLREYGARRAAYFEGLRAWCASRGVAHVETGADESATELALGLLRKGVLLR